MISRGGNRAKSFKMVYWILLLFFYSPPSCFLPEGCFGKFSVQIKTQSNEEWGLAYGSVCCILTNAVFQKYLFFKLVLVSSPKNPLAKKKSEGRVNCLKIRVGGIWLAEEPLNLLFHCPGEPFTSVYTNTDSLESGEVRLIK